MRAELRIERDDGSVVPLRDELAALKAHSATVPGCDECGCELTMKSRPVCMACAQGMNDDACPEEHGGVSADQVRSWADRRKALGFMTPELRQVFEDFADDMEAGDVT